MLVHPNNRIQESDRSVTVFMNKFQEETFLYFSYVLIHVLIPLAASSPLNQMLFGGPFVRSSTLVGLWRRAYPLRMETPMVTRPKGWLHFVKLIPVFLVVN